MREKLELQRSGEIPLREVSGLAVASYADAAHLLAVGDAGSVVAFTVVADDGLGEWETTDLTDLAGPDDVADVQQAEAIAADGAGTVVVLLEDPAAAVTIDVPNRRLLGSLVLDARELRGLAFLPDGSLVVASDRPGGGRNLGFFAPISSGRR